MAEPLHILFIPRRSRIRVYKIAKALRAYGDFKLNCVCEESFYDKEIFKGIFDDVIFYKTKIPLVGPRLYQHIRDLIPKKHKKLLSIVNDLHPDIIHSFAEPYDHSNYLLKNCQYPIVLCDGADFTGITAGIENMDKITRIEEKFVFENVQGICYKGPKHTLNYYKEHDYRIQGKELSWFDHSDEDQFVINGPAKLSENDSELHLVYSGNISTDPSIKYCYYPPLARALASQNIHLHIYANPYQYQSSREYQDLDKHEKYFHFHMPVGQRDLTQELAKYDWGLWVHTADPSPRTYPAKIKIGMTNKLFSYLEAGLPIIVSDSRSYGKQFIEENNIGFSINDADWDKFGVKIKDFDYNALKNNVLSTRSQYSLQKNGYKVAEFYKSILEQK